MTVVDAILGSARGPRAGERVLVIANFSVMLLISPIAEV